MITSHDNHRHINFDTVTLLHVVGKPYQNDSKPYTTVALFQVFPTEGVTVKKSISKQACKFSAAHFKLQVFFKRKYLKFTWRYGKIICYVTVGFQELA